MTERISSSHDSIQTHRVPLETVGRTDRCRVVLPAELDVSPDDVVELALDGDTHYATIDTTLDDDLVVRRATDNPRQAREGDGENRFATWVEDADVRVGSSVHLDVVTPGHAYGVRTPGEDVIYRATDQQSDVLADIAADLEDA